MFRRSKSKVLVDYASEEDDMSWHYSHSYKDRDLEVEEEEEAVTVVSKEAKVKKIMSKKERKDKKMFSSKDDEHFLLTRETPADRTGSHKKVKNDKDRKEKPEKSLCFWESVTMTIRQISPTKKTDKTDNRETSQSPKDASEDPTQNGRSPSPPTVDASENPANTVTWTSRARVKLAGIGRISRGMVTDGGTWEGLK
nr:splicing regulatory glutamine/lysine-rich protein 1-like [Nerophis lumbriciformis]